ncbi:unnamed protein product [Gongylonema pulchrum]|uniref:WD_REPEATS_REGION domain-containing protein n=1 Tax=Gongylonema pulchrum TaxID=637853 RepID=A0A183DD10_9BILA|nr:unnamed protein product [Gongylonema pulchrum]
MLAVLHLSACSYLPTVWVYCSAKDQNSDDVIVPSCFFQTKHLVGHKMSVWAVAAIPGNPGFYLTGSADLTIKYWQDSHQLKTFSGHEDVVRSLVVLSHEKFLSAANDATIRLWHIDAGACLQKFPSYSADYIYRSYRSFATFTEFGISNVG